MFYKEGSETTYEKMERGRKMKEGEGEGVERERERVAFLVYALSSINGLRFTHFVSNWASLFFYKIVLLFNIYSLTKVHFKMCYCCLSFKAFVFKYKIFSEQYNEVFDLGFYKCALTVIPKVTYFKLKCIVMLYLSKNVVRFAQKCCT